MSILCIRSLIQCVLAQPAPYQSFEHEVAFLEAHLGHLGGGGNAYVLGDALHGLRWHVYVASDGGWPAAARRNAAADHSIEVCMTNLCPVKVGFALRLLVVTDCCERQRVPHRWKQSVRNFHHVCVMQLQG